VVRHRASPGWLLPAGAPGRMMTNQATGTTNRSASPGRC